MLTEWKYLDGWRNRPAPRGPLVVWWRVASSIGHHTVNSPVVKCMALMAPTYVQTFALPDSWPRTTRSSHGSRRGTALLAHPDSAVCSNTLRQGRSHARRGNRRCELLRSALSRERHRAGVSFRRGYRSPPYQAPPRVPRHRDWGRHHQAVDRSRG